MKILRIAAAGAAILACGGAIADPADAPPLVGDAAHGAQLFRLSCAACHGLGGQGDGVLATRLTPAPSPICAASFSVARTDGALHQAILQGGAAVGKSALMPAFAGALSDLDAWDLVAYLRAGQPTVLDFFPLAGRYLAKTYTLDAFARDRLGKALAALANPKSSAKSPAVSVPLPAPAASLQVVTVFNGDREPGQLPVLEPQNPVTLDTLKPKDKLGYLVFLPVQLAGDPRPLPTGLAVDPAGRIARARSATGTADDARRDKLLEVYAGQGQRGSHKPLKGPPEPKRARGQKSAATPVLDSMDGAYARAMEAITLYEKEERDRTWADAPSK